MNTKPVILNGDVHTEAYAHGMNTGRDAGASMHNAGYGTIDVVTVRMYDAHATETVDGIRRTPGHESIAQAFLRGFDAGFIAYRSEYPTTEAYRAGFDWGQSSANYASAYLDMCLVTWESMFETCDHAPTRIRSIEAATGNPETATDYRNGFRDGWQLFNTEADDN